MDKPESLQEPRREPTIERLTELCSAMEKHGPRDWSLQMRQILDLHSAPEVSTVEERAVVVATLAVHTVVLETLIECGSRWPVLVDWARAALKLKATRKSGR